jgi:hypothetical protein
VSSVEECDDVFKEAPEIISYFILTIVEIAYKNTVGSAWFILLHIYPRSHSV